MSIEWVQSSVVATVKDISRATDVPAQRIILPNNLSINGNSPWDQLDGFGDGEFNAGAIRKVSNVAWNLRLPANSSSARLFRAIFTSRSSFTMEMQKYTGEGAAAVSESFELILEAYKGCYIKSIGVGYEIDGIPAIDISGLALTYVFSQLNENGTIVADANIDDAEDKQEFGSGVSELKTTVRDSLLTDFWG